MQGPKPPAFRPMLSLWPGEARELPAVVIVPIVERGGLVEWSSSARPSRVALPDDFVIREVVEAEDAVTFMRDWGLLVRAQDELRSLPEDDRPALPTVAGGGGSLRAPALDLAPRGRASPSSASRTRPPLPGGCGGGRGRRRQGIVEGFPAVSDSWTPWYWWTNHINAALRAFPMYVDFTRPDEEVHLLQTPSPTTYEIAALQLAQMATGGREVLRCANERCRRSFTRQRSSRRQYRGTERATGLKYCSRECAKAQSERDGRSAKARARQDRDMSTQAATGGRQRGSSIRRVALKSGNVVWRFRLDAEPGDDGKRRQRTYTYPNREGGGRGASISGTQ